MKHFWVLILGVFAYVLQTTGMYHIQRIGINANLTLVFICILGIYADFYFGFGLAVFLGVMNDILFSPWLGLQGILFSLIYLLTFYTVRHIRNINELKIGIQSVLATLLSHVLYLGFLFFIGHPIRTFGVLAKMVGGEMVGNAIFAVLLFQVFKKIYQEQTSGYII